MQVVTHINTFLTPSTATGKRYYCRCTSDTDTSDTDTSDTDTSDTSDISDTSDTDLFLSQILLTQTLLTQTLLMQTLQTQTLLTHLTLLTQAYLDKGFQCVTAGSFINSKLLNNYLIVCPKVFSQLVK